MKRVCIIGGGISGLCVAYRLKRAGIDCILYEKSRHLGGNIRSHLEDGFLFEDGPNSTLTTRELLDLINDLGLTAEIAAPQPTSKNRYILRNCKLVPLPVSLAGFARTKAFSVNAKLSILSEPFRRNRRSGDSVAAFFERRLGRELVNYAVDPFISGIYAGDADKLAVEYAFPKIDKYESDYGSILLGALRTPRDKKSGLEKGSPRSLSFKSGMQTLVDSLVRNLGDSVRLGCGDVKLTGRAAGRYQVAGSAGSEEFDFAVISTPAFAAANVIKDLPSAPVAEFESIYYPPITVVYTGYRRSDVAHDAAGFGFLVPSLENRGILGSLWTSSVFEGRAPDGHHLFTTFIGGSRSSQLCDRGDEESIALAESELASIMGVTNKPVFTAVKKWPRAIPQYNLGYGAVHQAIEAFRAVNPQVFFCANYYNGISVSDCIKNAGNTAEEIISINRND